jgi:hypothetical protein
MGVFHITQIEEIKNSVTKLIIEEKYKLSQESENIINYKDTLAVLERLFEGLGLCDFIVSSTSASKPVKGNSCDLFIERVRIVEMGATYFFLLFLNFFSYGCENSLGSFILSKTLSLMLLI